MSFSRTDLEGLLGVIEWLYCDTHARHGATVWQRLPELRRYGAAGRGIGSGGGNVALGGGHRAAALQQGDP